MDRFCISKGLQVCICKQFCFGIMQKNDRNKSIFSQNSGQKNSKMAEIKGILRICNEVLYFITFWET